MLMLLALALGSSIILAVPGGSAKHLFTRKAECAGINIVVRGEPLPSTVSADAPLMSCKDVSAAHANSPNLTSYTCFMPPADVEAAANAGMHNLASVPFQACEGEMVCNSGVRPPATGDASVLCSNIPWGVTISPYYPGAGCICAAWVLGSSEYVACNCNGCYNLSFTDLNDDCASLLSCCIEEYSWGGYHTFDAENSYTTLFLPGSASYQPVPFQECV
ncbi:hypothetical protein C8Q80DRAFT_1358887 [Daedaleopsis nitida]|nr:hypothetical protein C8Q80DRAFT_1358887 [Daedaleopsis nitida]